MTKIKICGLFRDDDIDFANILLPDYIGFVFAPSSRRAVTQTQAMRLRKNLDSKIVPVGVFVNHPIDFVAQLLKNGTVSIAQLHGQEDETYIRRLKKETSAPVIQAFKITSSQDIKKACRSCADYILLDNKTGGSGQRFDWSLIKSVNRPFFLAGGVNNENITEALQINPFAVDISSGVETKGVKDFEKMKAFVNTVRNKN